MFEKIHEIPNRMWVQSSSTCYCSKKVLSLFMPWPTVGKPAFFLFPGSLIPWPIVCEWHCIFPFARLFHYLSSHNQQGVSDTILVFYLCQALVSFHDQQLVSSAAFFSFSRQSHYLSSHDHQFVSDCSYPFVRQSHHLSSHDQQPVSSTPSFPSPGSLLTAHPMSNRMWVTLHLVFFSRLSYFSSNDQQGVSDTVSFA